MLSEPTSDHGGEPCEREKVPYTMIRFNIDTIDRVQVSPYGSPGPLVLWSANIDLIHRESGHRFARE
jgi:hypothetical protein